MTRVIEVVVAVAALVATAACAAPPCQAPCPPRVLGPAATAHTRVWRHGRATCRVTRRTPEVMRETAARVPRGDIFRSWESAARQ